MTTKPSVTLTQDNKLEILRSIATNLVNTVKHKLPPAPDVEQIMTDAYNNWHRQEIEPYKNSPFFNLVPTEDPARDYELSKGIESLHTMPNMNVNYYRGERRDFVGTTHFFLEKDKPETNRKFMLKNELLPSGAIFNTEISDIDIKVRLSACNMRQRPHLDLNRWNHKAEYNANSLYKEYYKPESIQAIESYNRTVLSELQCVKNELKQVIILINDIKTSTKFRKTLPQLVNLLPYDVIEREDALEEQRKLDKANAQPKVCIKVKTKTVKEKVEGVLDIDAMAKSIAFSKIVGG